MNASLTPGQRADLVLRFRDLRKRVNALHEHPPWDDDDLAERFCVGLAHDEKMQMLATADRALGELL